MIVVSVSVLALLALLRGARAQPTHPPSPAPTPSPTARRPAFVLQAPATDDVIPCFNRVFFGGEHAPTAAAAVRLVQTGAVADKFRAFEKPLYAFVSRRADAPIALDGGFMMPDLGLESKSVVIELELGSGQVATVGVQYVCSEERRIEHEQAQEYFQEICTEFADTLDALRSPERLKTFDFTSVFGQAVVACHAGDDRAQCTCLTERLRAWKQLEAEYSWARCSQLGFENVNFAAQSTELLDEIVKRGCVSAPCGQGGFCSTRDTCNTKLYSFTPRDVEFCGANAGCCEPPCSLTFPYSGLVQPGNCRDLEGDVEGTPFAFWSDSPGRVQRGNEICYPLPQLGSRQHAPDDDFRFFDENQFGDMGVFGCKTGPQRKATHCCAAVACTTGDPRTDVLDGLCMNMDECASHPLNPDMDGPVSNRCNDPSAGVRCCPLEHGFAWTSREIDNPNTNQQSAVFRPQFRDNGDESKLPSSASRSSVAASIAASLAIVAAMQA